MTADGCGISFWDNENVLEVIVIMFTQVCEYIKNHWALQLKCKNYKYVQLKCMIYNKLAQWVKSLPAI